MKRHSGLLSGGSYACCARLGCSLLTFSADLVCTTFLNLPSMAWHRQVLDQDYDWVFGSDVTYNEEALQPLAKLLRQMVLTNETAVVKLAHMHRSKELDKMMREVFHGAPQTLMSGAGLPGHEQSAAGRAGLQGGSAV